MPRLFALLPLLLIAACAGPMTQGPRADTGALARETALQRELVFERASKDDARAFSVMYPLLGANAEFCGSYLRPMAGLMVWNAHSVGNAYRQAAQSLYGLDDRLVVKTVARSSPALKAGILSGDIVETVNGRAMAGKSAVRNFSDALAQGPAQLGIRRDGRLRQIKLSPVAVCNFPIRVDHDSNDVNAYADGKGIIVTRGMMRFVENDDELALVLSHELAHNALTHVDKLQQNAMAGGLGGLLVDGLFAAGGISTNGQFAQLGMDFGATRHSVGFEQEADYVGMYFMERAGYSARGVAGFWRRMAAENSDSITARRSHPTSPERFLAIEGTYAEIAAKKKSGKPLTPNFTR